MRHPYRDLHGLGWLVMSALVLLAAAGITGGITITITP